MLLPSSNACTGHMTHEVKTVGRAVSGQAGIQCVLQLGLEADKRCVHAEQHEMLDSSCL